MDTDNFEDVKAYTVDPTFAMPRLESHQLLMVMRRNTHGKEIRYVTELTDEEKLWQKCQQCFQANYLWV